MEKPDASDKHFSSILKIEEEPILHATFFLLCVTCSSASGEEGDTSQRNVGISI
jgi:hypothetical protein